MKKTMLMTLMAWVLWQSSNFGISPEEGYNSKEECQKELESRIEEAANLSRAYPNQQFIREKEGYTEIIPGDKKKKGDPLVIVVGFRCLPDTVDPREPKERSK